MTRAVFFSLLSLSPLAVACGPTPLPPSTQSLRLRGGPPDANVYIDDQLVGSLDYVIAHGVALPRGTHHVTVRAPGYFPVDKEVDAKPAEHVRDVVGPIVVDVTLRKIPD